MQSDIFLDGERVDRLNVLKQPRAGRMSHTQVGQASRLLRDAAKEKM